MNTQTPFYVFSVQRVELSAEENRARVQFVTAYMRKAGVPFVRVSGRYKGADETAFLVSDPSGAKLQSYVLNLARLYEQESVLAVDANGRASLWSTDGARIAELGQWREVTAEQAAALEAVTEYGGRYWSAA